MVYVRISNFYKNSYPAAACEIKKGENEMINIHISYKYKFFKAKFLCFAAFQYKQAIYI